ncbi:MAG TPA: hypothetical protein DCE41_07870 [Cytophagales bacterium]|nr:hypothetical protein [Cytophagales bacterium]HAA19799.1 hypothetical protein [Cytophagales bacterium]HAP64226.1 hypothetical protein [Cytophagales bacterium]
MRDEGRRLKSIRKSLALTQAVFAEGLGLKQGPYSMIESGKVGLSSEVLRKLINTYRINPVFLFEGQGPMMMEAEVAEEVDLTANMPPIPADSASAKSLDAITLSRLAELRRNYPAADALAKNAIIEELINACLQLKDENSQQKDKIINLMQKLQNLLASIGKP